MMAKRITLLALVAFLVLLGGCIFSPEEDPKPKDDPDEVLPFAGSPQQLMANFQTVYEDRNYDGYLEVMDTAFRIFLKQETVQDFGLPRNFFEYAEEIQITENMFSGNPPSPDVGAISDINFSTFRQIDTWTLTENTEFPDALESQYDVDFRISQDQSDGTTRILNIKGRIIFFLSSEQVEYQGRPRTLYRMIGQIDETNIGVS